MVLDGALIRDVVRRALQEDLGDAGDLTTRICVPEGRRARARITAREPGVLAGVPVAEECFRALDADVAIEWLHGDGDSIEPEDVLVVVHGVAAALTAAERTALNFLQRLSGIATRTRAYVQAVEGLGARVFDTRKTTPGLRALEKYAVRVAGGHNHRFGLFDQVLIKENHFALAFPTPYEEVVRRAVEESTAPVVAEARDLDEALAAIRGGASVVMLDNLSPGPDLRRAVDAVRDEARRLGNSVEIESSGGVTLESVRSYAECGVDRISVGALTHSVVALDLSMLVEDAL